MVTSFRSPFVVMKRQPGCWRDGFYHVADDVGDHSIKQLTIQEPSTGDRNIIDAEPWGRRVGKYIKIYSDERLTPVSQEPMGAPGDIVVFEDRQYLIVGESNFTMLKRTRRNNPVSHYRYFAVEMIEHNQGEQAP